MSDREIHVERLLRELAEANETISMLKHRLDEAGGGDLRARLGGCVTGEALAVRLAEGRRAA